MKKRIFAFLLSIIMLLASFPQAQTPVMADEKVNIVSVDIGIRSAAAIDEKGTLWMWGENTSGQVGNGTTAYVASPVRVMSGVASVSTGNAHTAAVDQSGSLWMWGYNSGGCFGTTLVNEGGYTVSRSDTPVKVRNGVKSVAAGIDFTMILDTDGSLWMCGYNFYGEIGNGTVDSGKHPEPVKVLDNVVKISAGNHSCAALDRNGDLWTWGNNIYQQCGVERNANTGENKYITRPTKVQSGVADVFMENDCCGWISNGGDLYIMGYFYNREEGYVQTAQPQRISGNIQSFGADGSSYYMLDQSGALYTWGSNSYGELFLGEAYADVRGLVKTPVKAADNIRCADLQNGAIGVVDQNGVLYTSGYNGNGLLGNGQRTKESSPVGVQGNVQKVSLGKWLSAAVDTSGNLFTWGSNGLHGLGAGSDLRVSPTAVSIAANVADVDVNNEGGVFLDRNGCAWQFGNWTTNENDQNGLPVQKLTNAKKVAAGDYHYAAIDQNGDLYMWGSNNYGQLGDGSKTSDRKYTPEKVPSLKNIVDVALGDGFSAALDADGAVYVWGYNYYGVCANGNSGEGQEVLQPQKIASLKNMKKIDAFGGQIVALDENHVLWGWGANLSSMFGNMGSKITAPAKVAEQVRDVSVGGKNLMIVDMAGNLKVTGSNLDGQFGNGTIAGDPGYQNTGNSGVIMNHPAQISAGYNHCAALASNSDLFVWGGNGYGQIGNGISDYNYIAQIVEFTDVAYGDVDGDGSITASDALLVLKFVVRLQTGTMEQQARANVDKDASITAADALLILKHVVNLIDRFPAEG